MIARTLVPKDSKPLAAAAELPRRGSTYLDTRQIIPAELPLAPLDARSNIPAHVPLEVLAAKLVVPRDLPAAGPPAPRAGAPGVSRLPLTSLDDRVVIPRGAQPETLEIRKRAAGGSGMYEPDVLTTGVVNLLARPMERAAGWNPGSGWMSTSGSILIHGLLVALLILWPTFFPTRAPTSEEIEMAHRMLGLVYVPPGQPAPIAPPPPAPKIKVDPRLFQEVAPPEVTVPKPLGPQGDSPQPQRELPDAPRPQPSAPLNEPPRPVEPQRSPVFDSVKEPDPSKSPFALPKMSAGKALEDSLRGAARDRGGETNSFGGNLPSRPGPDGRRGADGSGGQAFGTMELLTPTEGVDFSNYLNRVLARVRYNWFAVIPESARSLGQKGIVVLEFRIAKNGSVPVGEPNLVRTSGREELDFASMSSIRSSNPFEPLPAAFSGPYIALRFTYLYNIPPDSYR